VLALDVADGTSVPERFVVLAQADVARAVRQQSRQRDGRAVASPDSR
jgi:hypothetical protein